MACLTGYWVLSTWTRSTSSPLWRSYLDTEYPSIFVTLLPGHWVLLHLYDTLSWILSTYPLLWHFYLDTEYCPPLWRSYLDNEYPFIFVTLLPGHRVLVHIYGTLTWILSTHPLLWHFYLDTEYFFTFMTFLPGYWVPIHFCDTPMWILSTYTLFMTDLEIPLGENWSIFAWILLYLPKDKTGDLLPAFTWTVTSSF